MGGSVLSLLVTLSKYLQEEMNHASLECSHHSSPHNFYRVCTWKQKTRISLIPLTSKGNKAYGNKSSATKRSGHDDYHQAHTRETQEADGSSGKGQNGFQGAFVRYLPKTVMASPSSLQFNSLSTLASSTARASWNITLIPS